MRLTALYVLAFVIVAGAAYGLWVTPTGRPDDYAGRAGTAVRSLFGLPPRTTTTAPVTGDLPPVVAPPPKPATAHAPDLGVPRSTITWHMKACKNAPGCNENGISHTCRELGVKTLRLTVTNERTHEKTTLRTPCPADRSDGDVQLDIPRGDGPWTLTATSDEQPSARTEVVCHIAPRCWPRGFSLGVYARGCNDPECVSCLEGTHAPGWCE